MQPGKRRARRIFIRSGGANDDRLAFEPLCDGGVKGGCHVRWQRFSEKQVADACRAIPDLLPAHFREVFAVQFEQDAFPQARAVQERAICVGGHAEKIGDAEAGLGQGRKCKRLAAYPGQIGDADLMGR
jgi:hypothetical protein